MIYGIYDPIHADITERMGKLYTSINEVRKKAYARAKRGYESKISGYVKRNSPVAYPPGYVPTKFQSKYRFFKEIGVVSPINYPHDGNKVIFIREQVIGEKKITRIIRKTTYLLNSDGSLGKKLHEGTYERMY